MTTGGLDQRDSITSLFGKPGDPVPEVDPEDIKAVCELYRVHTIPQTRLQLIRRLFEAACRPGTDVKSVLYRSTALRSCSLRRKQQNIKCDYPGKWI
jgi:hypothetical protein